MKKRLRIFVLLFLVLMAIMYLYIIVSKPLTIGVGYDTNEVILDFDNESIFPIYIDHVIVKNENDTQIIGKEFMYRLNSKRFNVTSEQLHSPDIKDEIEFFEPFTTLYIRANDDNVSNSILIEDGNFNEINEVKAKIRILGFLPFQVSREVELDINKVEEN